jgi:hypothetical protein
MKPCIWLLFITWELPQAILAALLIIIHRKKVDSCEGYKNARILYVKGFPGGISLGRIIILGSKYAGNDISKKHEYGHCRQSLMLGWLYLPLVGLPSILRVLMWSIRKLEQKKYYMGYPEDWANRLGFGEKEYHEAKKKLK